MTMQRIIIYFFGLLLMTACKQTSNINPNNVANIELIQVDHPYIGDKISNTKLDDKLITDFLKDFSDKKEEETKFFSCYVIKIHLKNGQLISYRTNGQVFEKIKDENTTAIYFKLNNDVNLISKYWKIPREQFCKE